MTEKARLICTIRDITRGPKNKGDTLEKATVKYIKYSCHCVA